MIATAKNVLIATGIYLLVLERHKDFQLNIIHMKSRHKTTIIQATPEKVFAQMDDFSKTGMHMSESSMMMMGSKLALEQISPNSTGIGAAYWWHGKMLGMTIDFREEVRKWEPPKRKEWETIGAAQIIIMRWYRMGFEITPSENGVIVTISIDYEPPKGWLYRLLSFLFVGIYCNWCLNNMLNDAKEGLENVLNFPRSNM